MTPEDRKYTRTHEWIKIEDDIAIIGITDHAQEAMGDITFIDLPEIGHVLEQDEDCGVVESVKAASDIRAPVAGEVAAVNEMLDARPEIINEDCYEQGWMFKVKDFDPAEIDALFAAPRYESFVDHENL